MGTWRFSSGAGGLPAVDVDVDVEVLLVATAVVEVDVLTVFTWDVWV